MPFALLGCICYLKSKKRNLQSVHNDFLCVHLFLTAWLTPCQIQRREAIGNDGIPVLGLFVPECKASGAYEPVQCHTDSVTKKKTCWCVNSHGVEIPDSRRKPGIRPFCGNHSTCLSFVNKILCLSCFQTKEWYSRE